MRIPGLVATAGGFLFHQALKYEQIVHAWCVIKTESRRYNPFTGPDGTPLDNSCGEEAMKDLNIRCSEYFHQK